MGENMKAKEYNLITQCVETGVMLGWNRAHKHAGTPDPEAIRDAIEQAVLNEICEWFDFEEVKTNDNN
jgi:hypothetical protein